MSHFDSLLAQKFDCGLVYEFWPALEATSSKVLIIMHGRGDTLEGFHFLPGKLGLDSLNVLFLQAPDEYGTGYSWYAVPPDQGPGILRSRQLLFGLLDRLQQECRIKSTDLFLCGFSQGSLMSLDVALRYPKVLGGVVGISGYLYFEEEYPLAFSPVAKQQRLWMSHGYQDDMLPFERTEASVHKLRNWGLSLVWVPMNKEHTVDELDEIPAIRAFLQGLLEAN